MTTLLVPDEIPNGVEAQALKSGEVDFMMADDGSINSDDSSVLPPPPADDDDDEEEGQGEEVEHETEAETGDPSLVTPALDPNVDGGEDEDEDENKNEPYDERKVLPVVPPEEANPSTTMGGEQTDGKSTTELHACPPKPQVDQDENPQHQNQEEAITETTTEIETQIQPQSKGLFFFRSKSKPKVSIIDTRSSEERQEQAGAPLTPQTSAETQAHSPASSSQNKTKVAERLVKAVQDAEAPNHHRSPDLVPLMKDYQAMRKRLRKLIAAAKEYQKYTTKLEESRCKLFNEFEILAKETPLDAHVSDKLDEEVLQSFQGISLSSTSEGLEARAQSPSKLPSDLNAKSLAALQQVQNVHAKLNDEDYQLHVLGYVIEWEQVVTTKLDTEIREVKKLQERRLHYEKKVDRLRLKVNRIESRGKEIPEEFAQKVTRNDIKLKDAWEKHEERAAELCVLLEEVTQQHWKDLYPLLKNTMRWELNRLGRENLTYGEFPSHMDAMKITFQDHVWKGPQVGEDHNVEVEHHLEEV